VVIQKVRDYVKSKHVLAEICVRYELHKKLKLPRRRSSLRDMNSVKVTVFKAYVGGVYRDQGLEAVTEWLRKLMRFQVEAGYQTVYCEYLQPSTLIISVG